ncbi:uncharacterized protein LOC143353020 [Halictus rubicundus]|uniref:uncharacterized protein LOC143353020 n=1 Tax=Halictus rubicundus TaxID=77578 RepID=UPI004036AD70
MHYRFQSGSLIIQEFTFGSGSNTGKYFSVNLIINCCEEHVKFDRNAKIDGRRWEYPIPKSKDYWEKFCRNEEKKLLVVRDPSVQLSYNSFPKNPSLKCRVDGSTNSEKSLHKLSPVKSKFKSHKLRNNNKELSPKPILKLSSESRARSSDKYNIYEPSKRTPKLGALRFDLSFRKIVSDKKRYDSSGIQNKPKSHSSSAPTLPILNAFPKISPTEPKKVKSNRSQLAQRKSFPEIRSARTDRKSELDKDSSKYPVRCAYKALKRVTGNKKLNFDRETVFGSISDPSLIEDEGEKLFDPIDARSAEEGDEESPRWKESLKDSQSAGIDVQRTTLKLEEMSTTIPSGSRSTSGSSPRFAHLEPWEGPSSRVLSAIPKLSGIPRKHRDRCLPCIYKSFESDPNRKTSLPITSLQKIINSHENRVDSSSDTSEDSDAICIGLPDFENMAEGILNYDAKKVTFDEPNDIPESRIEVTPPALDYPEEAQTVPEPESSRKAATQKDEEYQREEESVSAGKNLNDAAKFERVASSLERSKVSASLRSGSSDEDDSLAVSIDEDQSRPRCLAPCHMPTVLRPSLEPLRALRNRKPTTLQDRIAFLESSSKKSSCLDDQAEEKRTKLGEPEGTKEEKSGPAGRTLTKAKSVPGDMILERVAKKESVLRKGVSVANFRVPGDTYDEKATTGEAEDVPEKSDDLLKPYDSRKAARLPLTDTMEVLEVLQNLEEKSSTSMLETLCKEFSERVSTSMPNDSVVERQKKIMSRLTSLLVDSKRYLDPEKFPSDLVFSSNQPPPCNPRLLKRILPKQSYNLIAPLLGLPDSDLPRRGAIKFSFDVDQKLGSDVTVTSRDHSLASLEVHPPTPRDSESLNGEVKLGHRRYNPYALFLRKPRRKVITWRPLEKADLEGYDPNATLKMRTDNIMSAICQDFCRWLETLGGTDKTVDEEVLKDMFEIDFTAEACRSMQVLTREMPVVPAEVAMTRNTPCAGKLAMTKKHVLKDARAEETPARTIGFGTKMPWELQFTPPKNQVHKNWLQCDHVPAELETMDVVWKDITNLKSVRGFVEWLQQHPEVPPPEPLKTLVATDIETLRQVEDDEEFAHLELDIYQITSFRVAISAIGNRNEDIELELVDWTRKMHRDRAHSRHIPIIHTVTNLPTIDRTGANGRQEALPISFVNSYVRAHTFPSPCVHRMNVANRIALEPRFSAAYRGDASGRFEEHECQCDLTATVPRAPTDFCSRWTLRGSNYTFPLKCTCAKHFPEKCGFEFGMFLGEIKFSKIYGPFHRSITFCELRIENFA